MVIDENLPLGIIANTAAIMGITMGKQMPEVIKTIRERLYEPEFSDLTVVDFSDLAQGCKTYDEFIEKMKDVSETELNYLGDYHLWVEKESQQINRKYGIVEIKNSFLSSVCML